MKTPRTTRRKHRISAALFTLLTLLTPIGVFAGDWGDPDLGSLVLEKDGNAARVVDGRTSFSRVSTATELGCCRSGR